MSGQKIINYKEFDFANSSVIKPMQDKEKHDNRRYTRVVVDSRDRNLKYFPTPSQFEVSLPEDIEDVVGAELQIVDMPFTAYMISNKNNILYMQIGSDQMQVIISPGDYTPEQLASTIETHVLSQAGVSMEVTYDPTKDSYKFAMSQAFSFKFAGPEVRYTKTSNEGQTTLTYKENAFAKVIGFGPKDYNSTPENVTQVIYSEFRKNFNENKYIIMHVEQISLNQSINPILHKSFALIPNKSYDLNIYQQFLLKKTLNPPIPKLGRIKVTFTNYYGEPYDFQNHDHRFDIIFESYQHPRRYHSYLST